MRGMRADPKDCLGQGERWEFDAPGRLSKARVAAGGKSRFQASGMTESMDKEDVVKSRG